jgi:hypothetical protein
MDNPIKETSQARPIAPSRRLAVISAVLGLIPFLSFGIGFLFAIPAIIAGHKAYTKARRFPSEFGGRSFALTGIILGYLGMIFSIVLFVDAVIHAKRYATSINCLNQMKNVAMAARLWAADHQERMPTNFVSFKQELSTPRVLRCPGDSRREVLIDWSSFTEDKASYEFASTNVLTDGASDIYLRCRVHGHEARADGNAEPKALRY